MSMVSGVFSVKCSKCGKQHSFTEADVDFEGISSSEGPMGQENGYGWRETFDCDNCGNEIEIDYSVYEYPVGAVDHESVEVTGATVVSEFSFDFGGEPDDDYDQDDEDREDDHEAPEVF